MMEKSVSSIRSEIVELQKQLLVIESNKSEKTQGSSEKCHALNDDQTIADHKALRVSTLTYILNLPLRTHISGPFVYMMILPIALLDLFLVVFHATCFRLWKLPLVPRREYIVIDRHKLAYLNAIEKLNCIYCGYANGVFAYAQELAARTEHYWCPIKHASKLKHTHTLYESFVDFGDAENWQDHPSRKVPKRACDACLKNTH